MDLISVDSAAGKVYRHDGLSAAILAELSIPGGVHGAAWTGENLITNLYGGSGQTMKLFSGFSTTVLATVSTNHNNAWGIGWDGENVLLVNAGASSSDKFYNTLVQFNGFSGSVKKNIYIGGPLRQCVVDVFFYDGNTYVLGQSGLVVKFSGVSKNVLGLVTLPGSIWTGLAIVNGDIVACSHTTKTIYVYDGFSATLKSSFAAPGTEPLDLAAGTFPIEPSVQRLTSRHIFV